MDAEQVLAFRLARSGLARRTAGSLAEAAACPASDFSRDAALLALAARHEGVTRAAYDEATERADVVLAHLIRGAIHASAPDGFAQLGQPLDGRERRGARPAARPAGPAALRGEGARPGGRARRGRRRDAGGAGRRAAARPQRAARRAARAGERGPAPVVPQLREPPRPADAVALRPRADRRPAGRRAAPPCSTTRRPRRLRTPARPCGASSASTPRPRRRSSRSGRASRSRTPAASGPRWSRSSTRCGLGPRPAWVAGGGPRGARLAAAGPGRPAAPARRPVPAAHQPAAPRSRRGRAQALLPAVASPGGLLADGRLAGLWRTKARGNKIEIAVERLGRFKRAGLEEEAQRIADLRGAARARALGRVSARADEFAHPPRSAGSTSHDRRAAGAPHPCRRRSSPNLWFDTEAEEAARFYISVFKQWRIVNVTRYTEAGPREAGTVMTGGVRARRPALRGHQRRAGVHVRRGGLLRHRLRRPGGGRLLLGQADRGRRGRAVRLAEGQVRPLLAGRPDAAWTSCSPTRTRRAPSAR